MHSNLHFLHIIGSRSFASMIWCVVNTNTNKQTQHLSVSLSLSLSLSVSLSLSLSLSLSFFLCLLRSLCFSSYDTFSFSFLPFSLLPHSILKPICGLGWGLDSSWHDGHRSQTPQWCYCFFLLSSELCLSTGWFKPQRNFRNRCWSYINLKSHLFVKWSGVCVDLTSPNDSVLAVPTIDVVAFHIIFLIPCRQHYHHYLRHVTAHHVWQMSLICHVHVLIHMYALVGKNWIRWRSHI